MKTQVTEKQWQEVVAEVTRLAQEREDDVTRREITTQVLQELNLPTELIDDALRQVQYREALAKQRRRRLLLSAGGAILLLVLIISFWTWRAQHNASLAKISADAGRITLASDTGNTMSSVTRDGSEVFYRVTLRDVPINENLSLSCNWIDPSGKIFHQSNWQTRDTNKSVWDTFCRCRIGTAAPTGNWKVELKTGDRVLNTKNFTVE